MRCRRSLLRAVLPADVICIGDTSLCSSLATTSPFAFLRWGIMSAEFGVYSCGAAPGSLERRGSKSAVFNYRFPGIFHMLVAAANVDDDEYEDSKKYVLCVPTPRAASSINIIMLCTRTLHRARKVRRRWETTQESLQKLSNQAGLFGSRGS